MLLKAARAISLGARMMTMRNDNSADALLGTRKIGKSWAESILYLFKMNREILSGYRCV